MLLDYREATQSCRIISRLAAGVAASARCIFFRTYSLTLQLTCMSPLLAAWYVSPTSSPCSLFCPFCDVLGFICVHSRECCATHGSCFLLAYRRAPFGLCVLLVSTNMGCPCTPASVSVSYPWVPVSRLPACFRCRRAVGCVSC